MDDLTVWSTSGSSSPDFLWLFPVSTLLAVVSRAQGGRVGRLGLHGFKAGKLFKGWVKVGSELGCGETG